MARNMKLRVFARIALTLQRSMRLISWGLLFCVLYALWMLAPSVSDLIRRTLRVDPFQGIGIYALYLTIVLGFYGAVGWLIKKLTEYANRFLPRKWQLALGRSRTPSWVLEWDSEAQGLIDRRWRRGWRLWLLILIALAFVYWLMTAPYDSHGVKEDPW